MPRRYRLHSTNTPLVIICKKHVYHTFCIFCNSNSSQVIREGWLDLIPHLSNLNQLAALAIACINGDEAKEEFKRSWSIKEYLQLISQLGVATKAALTDAVAPKLPPNTWTNHWIEISFLDNFFGFQLNQHEAKQRFLPILRKVLSFSQQGRCWHDVNTWLNQSSPKSVKT